jgi:hypothetical protein
LHYGDREIAKTYKMKTTIKFCVVPPKEKSIVDIVGDLQPYADELRKILGADIIIDTPSNLVTIKSPKN